MAEDAVKFKFIADALSGYGEDVRTAMMREINRLGVKDTEALLNSISYKVTGKDQYSQGEIAIIFREYGRMVDMGVGKGRSLKNTQINRRNKYVTRKARKIYSPIAYGLLSKLISHLQYGLTDDVIHSIKSQLSQQP